MGECRLMASGADRMGLFDFVDKAARRVTLREVGGPRNW
jgi:hypothetical protein